MGCGCNKNKNNSSRTTPARGGLVSRQNPRPAMNPISSAQVRNSGRTPAQKLNSTGIMGDQKRIQQIRMNNILRNASKKR